MDRLDGYLTALIIGPRFIDPRQWIPLFAGERALMALEGTTQALAVQTLIANKNRFSTGLAETRKTWRPRFARRNNGSFDHFHWLAAFLFALFFPVALDVVGVRGPLLAVHSLAPGLEFHIAQLLGRQGGTSPRVTLASPRSRQRVFVRMPRPRHAVRAGSHAQEEGSQRSGRTSGRPGRLDEHAVRMTTALLGSAHGRPHLARTIGRLGSTRDSSRASAIVG